jgi:hypothetical protein
MSIRPTIAERVAAARRIPEETCYPGVVTYRAPTIEELNAAEIEEAEWRANENAHIRHQQNAQLFDGLRGRDDR